LLFSRIFNWIKYKTLPPSLLFLNRLFVERDSKHRRLVSNLGLTFRNSKWSMYSRINVNEITRSWFYSYSLIMLVTLTILLILYLWMDYYDSIIWFEDVFTLLWFVYDFELYITAFYTFLYGALLQLTFSFAQIPFVNNFIWLSRHKTLKSEVMEPQLLIPTRLHKSILYKWSLNTDSSKTLVPLFNFKHLGYLYPSEHFYSNLYRIVGILSAGKPSINYLFKSNQNILCNLKTLSLSTLSSKQPVYCVLTTAYKFNGVNHMIREKMKEFNSWNLHSINIEQSRYPLKTSVNPFYVTHLTYSDITGSIMRNTELTVLSQIIGYQSSLREWHHWLYKYNLLHRGILQDFSCESLMKQLIAPSFYSSTFLSRNMWASSITSDPSISSSTKGSYHEALYGTRSLPLLNTFLKKDLFFHTTNNIGQITFYNSSYNWFLQRFYNFNTLPANLTIWCPKLDYSTFTPQFLSQKDYNIGVAHFAWSLNKNQHTYETPFSEVKTNLLPLPKGIQLQPYHDVYLSYSDYTVFSKLNAEAALNLTINQGAPILKFFNIQNIFA
jgi:hypothetical protein